MNPLNLIILGPQGSGKGTQAEYLAKEFDLVFLGAGGLLRDIARTDSDLGREVHQAINVEGRLVRPEVVRAETMPLVEELEKEGRLVRVNGAPSIEEVHPEILKKLDLK